MKINLKAIIGNGRIYKNGTAPVFIRCTLNRKSKFISTGVAVNPSYWDAEKCCIIDDYPDKTKLQHQIDTKLKSIQKQIAKLEALDKEVTLDAISETKAKHINPTLEDCFVKHIMKLKETGKINTSIKYNFTLSSLVKYGKASAHLGDVDLAFLEGFEQFLRDLGNADNSIATKMSTLKAVYNREVGEEGTLTLRNPFRHYKVGKLITPTRKRAITKDIITKLIALELPLSRYDYMEFTRDVFLFSYYVAGMNFRDIALLEYGDITDNQIYYLRGKTGKEIRCYLVKPAMDILNKYRKNEYDSKDYIFPILNRKQHITKQQIHDRIHKVLQNVNRRLRVISKMLNLPTPITTYVARHTFATVLKRSGVDIAIISESLGHSDITTTQIYLDSFDAPQMEKALENLL